MCVVCVGVCVCGVGVYECVCGCVNVCLWGGVCVCVRGGAVGSGTVLQAGRSRVRFPMV